MDKMSSPKDNSDVSNENGTSYSPISSSSLPDSPNFEKLQNLKRKHSQISDQLKECESVNDHLINENFELKSRLEEERKQTKYLLTKLDSMKEEIEKLKHEHEEEIKIFKNHKIELTEVHLTTIKKWMRVLEDVHSIEMNMREADNSFKLIVTIIDTMYRKKLKEDEKIDELIKDNINLEQQISELNNKLENVQQLNNTLTETIEVKNKIIENLKRSDEMKRMFQEEEGENEVEMLSPVLLHYASRAVEERRDSSANSLLNELSGFQPSIHSTPFTTPFAIIYHSAVNESFGNTPSQSTSTRDSNKTESHQESKEEINLSLSRRDIYRILLVLFLLLALLVSSLYWTKPPGISAWDPCMERYSWSQFRLSLRAAIIREKEFPF